MQTPAVTPPKLRDILGVFIGHALCNLKAGDWQGALKLRCDAAGPSLQSLESEGWTVMRRFEAEWQ